MFQPLKTPCATTRPGGDTRSMQHATAPPPCATSKTSVTVGKERAQVFSFSFLRNKAYWRNQSHYFVLTRKHNTSRVFHQRGSRTSSQCGLLEMVKNHCKNVWGDPKPVVTPTIVTAE